MGYYPLLSEWLPLHHIQMDLHSWSSPKVTAASFVTETKLRKPPTVQHRWYQYQGSGSCALFDKHTSSVISDVKPIIYIYIYILLNIILILLIIIQLPCRRLEYNSA